MKNNSTDGLWMIHKVKITTKCKEELRQADKQLSMCLFKNFVQPIRNGLTPPHELQGKYKPSFQADFVGSPMADSFRKCAKDHNLHHYHIGFRFYRDGLDKDYPGAVSEGIAHTRISNEDSCYLHTVIKVSATHGSPFTIPIHNALDE